MNEEVSFLMLSGSKGYGLDVESSDDDYRGVYIHEDLRYYFSDMSESKNIDSPEEDKVIYDIRKAVKLIANGSPTLSEFLYTEKFIHCDEYWETIRANKDLFKSKKIPKSLFHMGKNLHHKGSNKQIMHGVRTQRMAIEYLNGDGFNVDRTGIDAEELLHIREHGLSDDYMPMDDEFNLLMESSDLPDEPDNDAIEELLVSVLKDKLFGREDYYQFETKYRVDGKLVPLGFVQESFQIDLYRFYLNKAMEAGKGSVVHAALSIDVSKKTIYNMMKRVGDNRWLMR